MKIQFKNLFTIEEYEISDNYIIIQYFQEQWEACKQFAFPKSKFELWLSINNRLDLVDLDGTVYGQYTIDSDEYSYYDQSINGNIKKDIIDYMTVHYWANDELIKSFSEELEVIY